jgi:hypothetical protein
LSATATTAATTTTATIYKNNINNYNIDTSVPTNILMNNIAPNIRNW